MAENQEIKPEAFRCQELAILYGGPADKNDQIVPFLKTALEHDQKCLYWFANPRERDGLEEAAKRVGMNPDYHLVSGQMKLFSLADFSFSNLKARLEAETAESVKQGYSRQLIVFDGGDYLKTRAGLQEIVTWQKQSASLRLPIETQICSLYDRQSAPAGRLRDILAGYPMIHLQHRTYRNYGYFPVPEKDSSAARAEAELDLFLRNLDHWQQLESSQAGRPDFSTRYLSELVDVAGLSVIFTDIYGTITNVNPATEEIYGYEPSELIGRHISLLYSESIPLEVQRILDAEKKEGSNWNSILLRKKKDGSEIPVWLAVSYIYNESGNLVASVGISKDISREQEQEEKLDYLSDLVESASLSIISTDEFGNIRRLNRAAESLYGYGKEEITGRHISLLYSPKNPPQIQQRLEMSKIKGETWQAEVIRKAKDGREFPVWMSVSYLYDQWGKMKGMVGISRDIDEDKKQEEKVLYMSELIEAAALGIISTDLFGNITSVNRAAEKMYGYPVAELIGKHINILYSEKNPGALTRLLHEKKLKGEGWEAEVFRKNQAGKIFPVWMATSYIRDLQGELKGIVGISRDISEERTIRERNEYMAKLVESASHCILSTDLEGRIISINRAGELMFGYELGELIGKPVKILQSERVPESLRDYLRRKSRTGDKWEAETLGRKKNGKEFPIWLAASYLLDEENRKKGAVGISRDIGKLKEAEERLKYMADLVESASLGIISTDRKGKIVSINKAGEKMFGYSARELLGKNISILHSEANLKSVLKDIVEKAEQGIPWQEELIDRRKDGTMFPIWLSTSYLFDASGEKRGAVSIIQDITHRKAMEKSILESTRWKTVAEMAAGVAHEIRNPLSSIVTSLKLLEDARDEANAEEYLLLTGVMKKETARLNKIVDEFLRFARPQVPTLTPGDLNALVLEVAEMVELDKQFSRGIAFRLSLAPESPPVCFDADQITQVLWNLLFNAIQATSDPGEILISTRIEGELFALSIKDSGQGIERDALERIFEPFFSTRQKGTGLGLAIVKRIIDTHNAKIQVKSEPGQGTEFTLLFPIE
ncbi:MAG: PAS domain S-box protein [Candidatus Erginobacter occultus]|nr:PAS domain S-box protein [Candidatus Erginobacter occultus]